MIAPPQAYGNNTDLLPPHLGPRLPLRGYQSEAIRLIEAAWQRGVRRMALELATGGGKTIIFAELIRRRGGRAIILAHRDELIQQAADKVRMVAPGADVGIVKAESDETSAAIVVASVQTLARPARLARLGRDFTTVVVDECHHAAAETYRDILEHLGCFDDDGPLTLGVTATLDRGDGVGLSDIFQEIVFSLGILPMIEAGHLSELRAIQVQLATDYNRLHTRAGDFIAAETGRAFLDANGPEQVAEAIQSHAADRKTLVFTANVASAHATAEAVRARGISAVATDGGMPVDERRHTFQAFRTGDIRVLANCNVATEGYDEPSVNCVVIARPTKSRSLYTQMIGRGTRRHPGKEDCLVLDVVGATTRHDLQTTATLFGLPVSALASGSVASAVATLRQQAETERIQGELVARTVSLFRQRPVHWVPTANGRFVLSVGGGVVVLRPAGDAWCVEHREGSLTTVLADGLSLEYSQGVAEDFARNAGAGVLIARDAGWRSTPPSDKQLYKLRCLGIPVANVRTKGEATDLITAALAGQVA